MSLKPLPDMMKDDYDEDSLVYLNDEEFLYGDKVSEDLIKDIRNKTIQIYSGYYIFDKGYNSPKIYLIGRGENSKKIKFKIEGFYPYCYVNSDEGKYKTYLGRTVEKMIFKKLHPSRIKVYRENRRKRGFPMPHEADILFVRRFLIDVYDYFKPKKSIEPTVAILDVETNHPINEDIIAYTINDQKDNLIHANKYDTKHPVELALEIFEHLKNYDIVTGWYVEFDVGCLHEDDKKKVGMLDRVDAYLNYARTGKEFSKEEYLENMNKGTIQYFGEDESEFVLNWLLNNDYLKEINGIIRLGSKIFDPVISHHTAVIDLLKVSKKMHAQEIKGKWTLDNVGIQMAGIGKTHMGATGIRELDEETLLEYNVLDTIIPEIIDNILGGIEAHVLLSWSLQCLLEDTMITAVVNDIALLRAYHRESIVLPSRDFSEKGDEIKYKAAEPDARQGVYRGILATDLVHAYPFAVISFNISPETKDPEGQYLTPNGIRFNDEHSVFIDTLKDIMEERSRIKVKLKKLEKKTPKWRKYKSIDFALKTQAAAFSHGIFGWANSRMRDYEVADSITSVVRDIIDTIKFHCDLIGKPWVYVHTDSCYLRGKEEEKEEILEYLNNLIKNKYEEMGAKDTPTLDYKGYYPYAYIHSPARNVLVPVDGDINNPETWDVTGMNFMRSEVPDELADIEIELIKNKMKGAGVNELANKLIYRVKKLTEIPSYKLGLIKPLTKPISEYGRELKDGSYGGYPGHINALIKAYDEYGLEIGVGDKFMIIPILTDETVGKRTVRRKKVDIAFPLEEGLPNGYKIDYEYYLRSNLWGKIHQLFNMKPKELEKLIINDKIRKLFRNDNGGK